MTYQSLNRLITVTGAGVASMHADTVFHYHRRARESTVDYPVSVGRWATFTVPAGDVADRSIDKARVYRDPLDTSDELAQSGVNGFFLAPTYFLDSDVDTGQVVQIPDLQDESPLTMRISNQDTGDFLEYAGVDVRHTVISIFAGTIYKELGPMFILWTDAPPVSHGSAFPIGEQIDVSFDGIGIPTVSPAHVTKQKWARLSERAGLLGVVLPVPGADFGAEEGGQETIEATIRYDLDLTNGVEFTDDLGRRWFITGTATADNRRFLTYSGSRVFGGLSL